jgi:hypothetical protein
MSLVINDKFHCIEDYREYIALTFFKYSVLFVLYFVLKFYMDPYILVKQLIN